MFVVIVIFIFILALLIFVHELGHFIAARLSGVKVEEFGIGYPPRMVGFRRGETIYSLNWIPLGGFCKMLGEEDPSEPRSLASKRPRTRLIVLVAGSFMMFVLPYVLLPIGYMIPHDVVTGGEGVIVSRVASGTPADLAGIQVDDVVVSANGREVATTDELKEVIDSNLGTEMTLVLQREGTDVEVTVVPRTEYPAWEGAVGVGISPERVIKEKKWYPFWEAIPKGMGDAWGLYVMIWDSVVILVGGGAPFAVTGIVGIAQATAEVADWGFMSLVGWACFLSINLGIVNLLPLPALDGGRIVFVLLEVVRGGKRVSPRTEGLVHLVGFAMLIGLMIVISYYDILRVISGKSLLQ